LAPFPAALLKDKVIIEIKEEIEALGDEVMKSRTVTIADPNGTSVYCQGQFDEGEYPANPNLWKVNLGHEPQPCTLSDMKDIEIRVGGIVNANFHLNNRGIEAFLDGGEDDYPDNRRKLFLLC
jgi:hypothetical protein